MRTLTVTFTLLFGYLNRNHSQALDIPAGPLNRIEPGDPDQGQPTHFLPVGLKEPRQLGVFALTVPMDFGNKKVTWTLTANGETNTVPGRLHPDYVITPFGEPAQGDTPPEVRFSPDGAAHYGPPREINATFQTTTNASLTISVWVSKKPLKVKTGTDQTALTLRWTKYRGLGTVTFTGSQAQVISTSGKASTIATFASPGDYILRLEVTTSSDRGSNQCCRTNALVKITVV